MKQDQRAPVAIVTGCSSGIGLATARLLAEQGWWVFATARRPEAIPDLGYGQVTPLHLDVIDESSRTAAIEQVRSHAGRIDALVNSAGYSEVGPLEEATTEEVQRQFATNAFGPLRLAQLVLPTMRMQRRGRIVNVSSINGRVVIPFIGLYCGSKFALEAMSDALRLEAGPFGVHVIVVTPGATRTNFTSAAAEHVRRFATDRGSAYHRYFDGINRFVAQSTVRSSAPEAVAAVIYRALTAQHPRVRYTATADARLILAIVPRLPGRIRDAVWRRLLGLGEAEL